MKYAYIFTGLKATKYDNTEIGWAICQVQDTKEGLVNVEDTFFWVECDDETTPANSYYDMADQQVKLHPVKPIE
jgi:hypothetical protein